MRRLLLTTAAIAALAAPAHAELFTLGSTYNLELTNSPDSGTFTATLAPGTQLIDGGKLDLITTIVPTAGGGEWLAFRIQTANGSPFQNGSLNWGMSENGLVAAVPVNFDNGFNGAFVTNSVQATFTGSPFGNFSPGSVSNIGTSFGPGLYTNSPFSSPTGPGPIFNLFAFIDPFSIINGDGVNSATVTGWEEAWHFDPQTPITGAPEPTTLSLLGLSVLGVAFARRRRA